MLIGNYPNTYSYTKSLAEKMLSKKRGNLKLVICRPSIVGASFNEPYKGWCDSLSAAAGLSLLVALGLVSFLHIKNPGNHFDLIPVDMVSNGCLLTSAYADKTADDKGCLHIYNLGTSHGNPITIGQYINICLEFSKYFTLNKRVFPVSMKLTKTQLEYDIMTTIYTELPIRAYDAASRLPYIGSKGMQKQAEMIKKGSKKI